MLTQQNRLKQAQHRSRKRSQLPPIDDHELMDSEEDADNDDEITLQHTDHADLEAEGTDSQADDNSWLHDVDSQAYEDRLWARTRAGAWLHGLSDLPTPEEYSALSTAPEPDTYSNPVGMREDAPLIGGCVHGPDPS